MAKKLLISIVINNEEEGFAGSIPAAIQENFNQTDELSILIIVNNPELKFGEIFSSPSLFKVDIYVIQLRQIFQFGKIQKIAFEYAIRENYDLVTITDCQKFKIFGSQLKKDALVFEEEKLAFISHGKSNKPVIGFIKFIQKRIFKRFINNFFPGLLIYKVDLLKQIPFEYNSNTKIFHSELMIQFLLKGSKYKEYITDVNEKIDLRITLRTVLLLGRVFTHMMGLFYQKKFDVVKDNQHYNLKLGYASSHSWTLRAISENSKVIDIGAGPYGITKYLLQKNCDVTTVDMFDISDEYHGSKHIVVDLNSEFNVPLKDYDYILFLDIIEHLKDPEKFLSGIAQHFNYKEQTFIFTTGNIAFFPVRLMLLIGLFNYGKSGILDKTHTRLFTFTSFLKFLKEHNLEIIKVRGIPAPYPKAIGTNLFAKILLAANLGLIKLSRGLFSYQIFVICKPTPSPKWLSREATSQKERVQD